MLKASSFSFLGSACPLQAQSLNSTTHLVRVLKVSKPLVPPLTPFLSFEFLSLFYLFFFSTRLSLIHVLIVLC